VDLGDSDKVTVMDGLFQIQQTQDKTFRSAIPAVWPWWLLRRGCQRQRGLACKTMLREMPPGTIIVAPLRHIPVVKDLTVDLKGLIRKLRKMEPYFVPKSDNPEPAVIRPDSKERRTIALNTECIACGSCISSCTMMHWDPDYLGPMNLNRAFCLIADSRDADGDRLRKIAGENGIYRCHMEFNCTDVCPKHISPTRGIHHLKRQMFWEGVKNLNPFRRGKSA
jgi:succinate dehydrogenase/fumarate reductase iron-sulfur protein